MPMTNSTEHMSRQYAMMNDMYELPNTRQIIQYYHATPGFPMKATWLKAIWAGFYATWPMLTTRAVMKYSLELDETQKQHMGQNKGGVHSTEKLVEAQNTHVVYMPQLWLQEMSINIEVMKNIMYINQKGKFSVLLSQGNGYIMVLCKADGNLILVELMKDKKSEGKVQGKKQTYSTVAPNWHQNKVTHSRQGGTRRFPQNSKTTWHRAPKSPIKHALQKWGWTNNQHI